MSRFEKRMLWALGLLILLFAMLEASAPKPTDWSPSYSRYHTKPYGGKLVYERLADLFPEVRAVHDAVEVTAARRLDSDGVYDGPVNHLFINERFGLDQLSTDQLLQLASLGDHVFVAAEVMNDEFAHALNLDMDRTSWTGQDTLDIRFIGEPRIAPGVFRFARGFPGAHFTRYDTARTRVLAVDGAAHPVLLEMTWGAGRIVLCSAPRAFANYNLLKNENARFMAGALSVLPTYPIVWDEFYKAGRSENTSILRFLLKEPALRWAWYMALVLILLFMIVYARRQQRAIPIMTQPRNASRELAHTIGRLYWQKGDHAGLARKMIAHFKDEVRARTYLRTFAFDDTTIAHLATKTGLTIEEMGKRLRAIEKRENASFIPEQDLLQLSTELHDFRKLIR